MAKTRDCLRDALGVAPPPGLPAAFLEPSPHALREVVARYARTHGPFAVVDVAHRYGLGHSAVLEALAVLRQEGRVLEGEFRPGAAAIAFACLLIAIVVVLSVMCAWPTCV